MCLMRVEGSTLMRHHHYVRQLPENKIEREETVENAETTSSSPPLPEAFQRKGSAISPYPFPSAAMFVAKRGMPYHVMP